MSVTENNLEKQFADGIDEIVRIYGNEFISHSAKQKIDLFTVALWELDKYLTDHSKNPIMCRREIVRSLLHIEKLAHLFCQMKERVGPKFRWNCLKINCDKNKEEMRAESLALIEQQERSLRLRLRSKGFDV